VINITLEAIIDAIKGYNPDANFDLIRRAYAFGAEAHKDQFRASGEPFFKHPASVALIVATELRLDSISVCAALLHDTIEDNKDVKVETIEKEFGAVVAHLVEGVTKLNKMSFKSATAAHAASFRKMMLAMTSDVRVILIKLADRIHNIRTLQYLPPAKQADIAKETLEIYSPLAHRLGINKFKSELEETSFRFLLPEKAKMINEYLEKEGIEGDKTIEKVLKEIKEKLAEYKIKATLSGRPKQAYSIYNKTLKYNSGLETLYDFLGIRILTDSVKDCYAALGLVHQYWRPIPGRFKDYIAVPKPNLYQSLHTSVIYDGGPLEVQIRTYEMNRIAEDGIAAHWDYKESNSSVVGNTLDFKEKLSWLRNLIEWCQEVNDASELMETVKVDLFQYHVYVFTPNSEVIELPRNSTPIDFAYAVHTEVGHRCIGAKVNGHIVPLDYKLKNGDIVRILTSKGQRGPSRDWLKIAGSASAKRKIRNWLKKEFRDEYILGGERDFLDAFHRLGGDREDEKSLNSPAFAAKLKELGFPSLDELYAGIGAGEVKPQQMVGKLFPEILQRLQERQNAAKKKRSEKEKKRRTGKGPRIIVGGLEDALIKISKCCNPIPGDDIIGYITRGRGVTVHKKDCPNTASLTADTDNRIIDARWDLGITEEILGDSSYEVKIRVETTDRRGMLNSITSVMANQGINIISASAKTTKEKTGVLEFSIEVGSLVVLNELIRLLLRLTGVSKAYRIDKGRQI
jgi:guanosine-3',5'-bis(diphosphate) 3'-pyrophosphohydrolase